MTPDSIKARTAIENRKAQRLYYLDNIRAIAIFMVVCIHATAYTHKFDEPLAAALDFIIFTISVPVFFFADGFLFARLYKHKYFSYSDYIVKSSKRLLIPWLAFNILYTALRYFAEYYNFLSDKILVKHSTSEIITAIYGSLTAPQLYFLFSLFLIRLLSAFTNRLITKSGVTLALLFLLCIFLYRGFDDLLIDYFHTLIGYRSIHAAFWGLQYYFFGIIIERYFKTVSEYALLFAGSSFVSMLILLFYFNDTTIGRILIQYCYLTGLFTLILSIAAQKNFLSYIGKNTMGIYLLHNPVLLKGLFFIIPVLIVNPFLSCMTMSILAFAISLSATVIILKIPYCRFFLGA